MKLNFFSDASPDFTSTTEERRTDTTIPETTKQDRDFVVIDSSGTTALQENTHSHTFGTSTTAEAGTSSSSSTSTSLKTSVSSSSSSSTITTSIGTSTTTSTRGTTPYVPPQTDTTIPYVVKETIPPEPSIPDHDENEIPYHHPDPDYYDHGNHAPEIPMEPETEPPAVFRTPPPFNPNPGVYPTRMTPKNKHARINTEAEERTAMIIGIVAGALIAVILVILLVLWIKSNGDRTYKMEHDLKYGHGANAALLGHNAGHSSNQPHHGGQAHHGGHNAGHQNNSNMHQQQNPQYGNGYNQGGGSQNYEVNGNGNGAQYGSNMGGNGSLRQQGSQHSERNGNNAGLVQPKAKRNSKDIKEWYV